ncbi:cytosolic phospholipase A2 gamma-like isoform X2 [Antennarius striatus]|uniref:cytosolic phospholipase A2 gamma-like isoform X2 n=1 Tax=Antennarius striatus TaxID=241820 RepID=UPI0035AF18BE
MCAPTCRSMASLYSDPHWSTNMDTAVARLSGPRVEPQKALAWLGEKAKEEYFSLTDIWGVITSVGIMKEMELRHLSDEANRDASNPYPIYCAIEKYCYSNGPIQGKWFELSPHEAGFTELGLFIETSLLGSRFHDGVMLEKVPEMDMVQLQGILGCALAVEDTIRGVIPPWMNVPEHIDSAAEYLRVYNYLGKIIALTRIAFKDPAALSALDQLQIIVEETMKHNESMWLETKSMDEKKSLFKQWSLELVAATETWRQSLEDGDFKDNVSLITNRILPLIIKWEWGTTRNFLYQYQDETVPPCLNSDRIHLIDAGLLVNVGYPSFLGDKRDIDLFIAPEYSAGDMFETLTLARDYAAEVKKPFPEIHNSILEEKDWPKDCYVFEGKDGEPTIVFMPLFNRNNCKDADEYKAKMEEFSTFQRPFSQEKTEFVLETAKANMKNNKETLLREINKAVVRRQKKLLEAGGSEKDPE